MILISIKPLLEVLQMHLECDVTETEEKFITLQIEELSSIPNGKIGIEEWMTQIDMYWNTCVGESDDFQFREELLAYSGFTEYGVEKAMSKFYWDRVQA